MARKSRVIRRSNNRRSNNRLRKTKRKKLMGGSSLERGFVDRAGNTDYSAEAIGYCVEKLKEGGPVRTAVNSITDDSSGGKHLLNELIKELYEYIRLVHNCTVKEPTSRWAAACARAST